MRARGFTYIEITMVAGIICLLAMIAVPNFINATIRARVARTMVEVHELSLDIYRYHSQHGRYPPAREPGMPRSDWMHALTSPVVYRSQIPRDVFDGLDRHDRRTYVYVRMFPDGESEWADQAEYFGLGYSGLFRYAVISAGPDLVHTLEDPPGSGQWSPLTPGSIRPYDPGNGITSEGDIFALGPR